MIQILLSLPIYRWENWGLARLNIFPNVTQLDFVEQEFDIRSHFNTSNNSSLKSCSQSALVLNHPLKHTSTTFPNIFLAFLPTYPASQNKSQQTTLYYQKPELFQIDLLWSFLILCLYIVLYFSRKKNWMECFAYIYVYFLHGNLRSQLMLAYWFPSEKLVLKPWVSLSYNKYFTITFFPRR